MDRPLVLHDADCGFCTRCARAIPRLGARVRVSSLQAENLAARGVDPARAETEMPVVRADGTVAWGHHAWAEILLAAPLPLAVAGRVLDAAVLERPAGWVYRWVASHRHVMPGGTAACAMPLVGD